MLSTVLLCDTISEYEITVSTNADEQSLSADELIWDISTMMSAIDWARDIMTSSVTSCIDNVVIILLHKKSRYKIATESVEVLEKEQNCPENGDLH
jgi:hypothetical protein